MKHYLGAAALALALAAPSAAQSPQQSSESPSGSRIPRAAPVTAQGSPQEIAARAKEAIAIDKRAGKVPDRKTLKLLLSAQASLKDEAGMADTLEEEVAGYNDPADWVQLIGMTFNSASLRDQDAIWLGRLLFVVGGPVSANDAAMVGQIASQHGYFGDAVAAKVHGGAVDPDPGPRADEDKKTIAQQIAGEQAGDATYNAKLAEALVGYGMYPEAEAAARAAMQKGGDAGEMQMVLGQALTAQKKYDEAVAAFGQASGGGAATARIARLWADYAKIKKAAR
jgi:tetratricopeptide (TPR) repeat protein